MTDPAFFWHPLQDPASSPDDEVVENAGEYIEAPLNPEAVAEVERRLGYRLPEAYLNVMRAQNGGIPLHRTCPLPGVVEGLPYGWIEGFFGIGWTQQYSLCSSSTGAFWMDVHGFPDIGVYFAQVNLGGPGLLALDYRACGPQGEPAIALVTRDSAESGTWEPKIFPVAHDVQSFLAGLLPEDDYLEAQDAYLAATSTYEIVEMAGEDGEGEPDEDDHEEATGTDTFDEAVTPLHELYARRPEVYDSPEAAARYGRLLASLLDHPDLSYRLWGVIEDHAAFLSPPLVADLLEASWKRGDTEPETAWHELKEVPLPAARLLIRRLEELDLLAGDSQPALTALAAPILKRWFSAEEVTRRAQPIDEQNQDWIDCWMRSEFVRVPAGQAATLALQLCDAPPDAREKSVKWLGALRHLLVSHPLGWDVQARVLERLIGDTYLPVYGFDRLSLHLHERQQLPVSVLGGLRRLFVVRPPVIPWPFDVYAQSPELNPGEPWADEVLGRLASLTKDERARWAALFEHASQVGRVDDTNRQEWLAHGQVLIESLGREHIKKVLPKAGRSRSQRRVRPWLDTGDVKADLYNELVREGLTELRHQLKT